MLQKCRLIRLKCVIKKAAGGKISTFLFCEGKASPEEGAMCLKMSITPIKVSPDKNKRVFSLSRSERYETMSGKHCGPSLHRCPNNDYLQYLQVQLFHDLTRKT